MNREAINYVKDAEIRVDELRANAEAEIKALEEQKQLEIKSHKDLTHQEVTAYRKEKYEEMEQRLIKDEMAIDESVKAETVKFDAAYEEKKNLLANRIAEEVLRRYGNS